MEKAKRRCFTEDYKRQTVELVRLSGHPIDSVAAEIELAEAVLRKWVNKFGDSGQPAAESRRPLAQAALPTADRPPPTFSTATSQLRRQTASCSPTLPMFHWRRLAVLGRGHGPL